MSVTRLDVLQVTGIMLTTASLLAFAVTFYEFILQIVLTLGLFTDPRQNKARPFTSRQLFGQFIFLILMALLAYSVLLFFKPYGKISDKPPPDSMKVIADDALIRDVNFEDIAVIGKYAR